MQLEINCVRRQCTKKERCIDRSLGITLDWNYKNSHFSSFNYECSLEIGVSNVLEHSLNDFRRETAGFSLSTILLQALQLPVPIKRSLKRVYMHRERERVSHIQFELSAF